MAAINDRQVVAFLGAGVSMPPPSSLPSSQELADQLVDKGYGTPGDDLEAVAEKCWQEGGWQVFARAIPKEDWRARTPNQCHVVLAELAAEGLIAAAITTNWDTLLEAALVAHGVPHTRIVRPEDLAVWDNVSFRVVKPHGCIDHPEAIRARSGDVDSDEWLDDWAETVFADTLRTTSVMFVGYSGASRATTKTIKRIMAEQARPAADWLIDRSRLDVALDRKRTAELVDALERSDDFYVEMDSVSFFETLRVRLFPLLLARPKAQATSLVKHLVGPTRVDEDDVLEQLGRVVGLWADRGQLEAQRRLGLACPTHERGGYVPVIPNASAIGRFWAWLALGAAAGVVELVETGARLPATGAVEAPEVFPVLCDAIERRDQVAAEAVARLAAHSSGVAVNLVGVLVGGVGPLPSQAKVYDVVRGAARDDVVRGGAVNIRWVDSDALFAQMTETMDGEALRGGAIRVVDAVEPWGAA